MTEQEKVKQIKQSFRQMMDGAVAQSMRQKGLDYKLNWGATLPMLRQQADELRAEGDVSPYKLAIELWKEAGTPEAQNNLIFAEK